MKLQDTVELMLGTDFKDRFKAEYYQLDNRIAGLQRMLEGYKNGTLNFTPNCSYEILNEQLACMKAYRHVLIKRAKIENIEL